MAFPDPPSGFHHEADQRYVSQNGKWIRAGAKGLPMATDFKGLQNAGSTGNDFLFAGGQRLPENKIIIDCSYVPSDRKQCYIGAWNQSLGIIDFPSATIEKSRVNLWWGTNCKSIIDFYGSNHITLAEGLPLLWKDDLPEAERPVHIHIEFLRSVPGWSRIEWKVKYQEPDTTTVDLEGSAAINIDLSRFAYFALAWTDTMLLRHAGMLTQWW